MIIAAVTDWQDTLDSIAIKVTRYPLCSISLAPLQAAWHSRTSRRMWKPRGAEQKLHIFHICRPEHIDSHIPVQIAIAINYTAMGKAAGGAGGGRAQEASRDAEGKALQ